MLKNLLKLCICCQYFKIWLDIIGKFPSGILMNGSKYLKAFGSGEQKLIMKVPLYSLRTIPCRTFELQELEEIFS